MDHGGLLAQNRHINLARRAPTAFPRGAHIVIHKSVIPAGIHARLSCPSPFGLMQICSRQICAGIQTTWKYLSSPSLTTTLRTGHGTGYLLPCGYDELLVYLCITMSAAHGNEIVGVQRLKPLNSSLFSTNCFKLMRKEGKNQVLLQTGIQFVHHGRHIACNHLADEASTQIERVNQHFPFLL
jgi:hypothetical protein